MYDPSQLNANLKIKKASISNGHLNINFTDGIKFNYEIKELFYELKKNLPYEKPILWNSKLKNKPLENYKEHMFDTINMYDLLQNFIQINYSTNYSSFIKQLFTVFMKLVKSLYLNIII